MCKKHLVMLVVITLEGRGDDFPAGKKRERPRAPETDGKALHCTSLRIDANRVWPSARESSARLE
jgi:hypothetical protein